MFKNSYAVNDQSISESRRGYQSTTSSSSIETPPNSPTREITLWAAPIVSSEVLGRGGQGTVHRIILSNGDSFAAKSINSINEFDAELRAYQKLELVDLKMAIFPTLHGIKEFDSSLVIVTELVNGCDLKNGINKLHTHMKSGLRASELNQLIDGVSLLMQNVSYGLKILEQCKLSHGDIKAENIMIEADGNIKILDFGMTKDLDSPVKPEGTYG